MASTTVTIGASLFFLVGAIILGVFCYLIYLCIKALRKYIRTKPIREEKAQTAKTLGGVLKEHRIKCNMTQEFVAEALGVSRQAVSKWETGATEPSTTNLIAIAKLYDIAAEEILKEVTE